MNYAMLLMIDSEIIEDNDMKVLYMMLPLFLIVNMVSVVFVVFEIAFQMYRRKMYFFK